MTTVEVPEGWVTRSITQFDELIGPFYFAAGKNDTECGFIADERHANRRGIVHGGMISTAFDVALGTAARKGSNDKHHATVQLGVQFIDAMKLGEFAVIRCELVRATRSLVFMRGVMRVGERIIAIAEGVWKTLEPRKPA